MSRQLLRGFSWLSSLEILAAKGSAADVAVGALQGHLYNCDLRRKLLTRGNHGITDVRKDL